MSLMQMSTSGAVLILVIILVRALFVHRLPKKTFTTLWTIALLRLLIPVSVPSTLSVYSWLFRNSSARGPIPGSPIYTLLPVLSSEEEQLFASNTLISSERMGILWLIGVFLFALYFGCLMIYSLRKFHASVQLENCFTVQWIQDHKIHRLLKIQQSSEVKSPLTYGVIQPVILLPSKTCWNDTESLALILEHEYVHIVRYDSVRKVFMIAAVCIHWFNPFVWIMFFTFNRDIELSCDEEVLHRIGLDARSQYARMLINAEEKQSYSAKISNHFCSSSLEERIIAIMKSGSLRHSSRLISIVLVLAVCVCFATSSKVSAIMDVPDYGIDYAVDWVWPVKSKEITLTFGEHRHPITGEAYYSDHVTIKGTKGESVRSAICGTVTATGYDTEYGYYVVVTGANQIRTFYGYLQAVMVNEGSVVGAGELIGIVGSTGTSTGVCLAFAVFVKDEAVDPLDYYEPNCQ